MIFFFLVAIIAIVAATFGLYFLSRMRSLAAADSALVAVQVGRRYQPMLRLLSESDVRFVGGNRQLRRMLLSERRRLFRVYLRSLARDYGRLLSRVRMLMVQSGVDRPDLARALRQNRTTFAWAICRVEFRLALHAAGIGTVDVSGLVDALDLLRAQVAAFSPAASPAMSAA